MIITMNHLKGHFLMNEGPADTYTVHPLVCLAIRRILEGERPQADEEDIKQERKWYEEVVVTFSEFYPDLHSDDREWWRGCFGHLLAEYSVQTDPLKLSVSKMHRKDSAYFERRGRYSEALKEAILAKNVLPDPLKPEHLGVIQDHIALLELLGRYREIQALLQTYPPDEQPSTILWKKRMQARLEQAEGSNRYDSAVEIFRQLKISGETTNNSISDLLQSIDDLGYVLMLKGKYHDAAIECRKALAGRTTLLGTSHQDTLASFHHLASILKLDGKFQESLVHVQAAIRGREEVLGADHPETLQSKIVKARLLASTSISLSDFDEAETLLVDSSHRLSRILSDSHPLVIACRSDHAQIMFSRGKYDAAEQMNRQTLVAREQGPYTAAASHPETLESVHQLAELLRYKEGCRAADALSERAWTERTDVLTHGTFSGSDFHPDQLNSIHHRAIVLSGLGLHLPALQKIDSALFGRKTILRRDHPDIFLSLTWKGEIMRSQLPTYQTQRDQTLDAIEGLHKQALEGLTCIFGSEHHNTLQCLANLALAKHERGTSGLVEAEALHRQVYRAYQRNLGDLHPETCKSKCRLAEAMRALSPHLHQESKRMWREACGGFAQMFGVDPYLTVTAHREYEKFLKTYSEP
jgi:tetratricopeptide (TPR) repeat protein